MHYATKQEAQNTLLCLTKELAKRHKIVQFTHTWLNGTKEIRYCVVFTGKIKNTKRS